MCVKRKYKVNKKEILILEKNPEEPMGGPKRGGVKGAIQKEESRAGNSCCGEEQMAIGGVVTATVPGHPPHGWADQNN